jgi:putative SOS response-associated peptidase YedK
MCGRFDLALSLEALRDLLGVEGPAPALPPRWNVAPTQPVTVLVIPGDGKRALRAMRWGLVPSWARDPSIGNRMINARAETLAEKPSFRDALRRRRCLIPATGFYEWRREGRRKVPLHVRPRDGGLLTFAGLWESWTAPDGTVLETCTIVTCPAGEPVARFHERMPVILPPEARDRWLAPGPLSPEAIAELLVPAPGDLLVVDPASPRVNSPANEGPELLDPGA